MKNKQYRCVFGSLFHLERNKYCLTFTINIESSLIHSMNIFKISVCFKITYLMTNQNFFSAFKSNIFLIKNLSYNCRFNHATLYIALEYCDHWLELFSLGDKTNLLAWPRLLIWGVTKTRNGKRNGMENGLKRTTKWKFPRKTKYKNFVDTTAYKGKRFEIKQNLDF